MLKGNNQAQMMLQFFLQVQGMTHISADNYDYAKRIKNKFIQGINQ